MTRQIVLCAAVAALAGCNCTPAPPVPDAGSGRGGGHAGGAAAGGGAVGGGGSAAGGGGSNAAGGGSSAAGGGTHASGGGSALGGGSAAGGGSATGGGSAMGGGATGGGCTQGTTQPCTTACGSTGTATCMAGSFGTCAPPAESCNLQDDDCNGTCDDFLGCRVAVNRSYNTSAAIHFYSTSDAESECCGFHIEVAGAFFLFPAAHAGLAPLYRCLIGPGNHLYTTDANCEGAGTSEGAMGYLATQPICGAVPLYRLVSNGSGDHLYTTSMSEVSAAVAGGYVSEGAVGYVWPSSCEGANCTWSSPTQLTGETTASVTGFPTAWYGFPVPAGTHTLNSIVGSLSVSNPQDLYSEVLFILQYLPMGTCTVGRWPSSTPEFGPPGAGGLGQFIVKAPVRGTYTQSLNLTLPGGLPFSGCLLLGLNGGPVVAPQPVTITADLSATWSAPPTSQSYIGMGGEFCFGQSWGCVSATTDDTKSFVVVTNISSPLHLVALAGNISDTTFDGTASFGPLPSGPWTALNDFYVYHGAECSALNAGQGWAGPGTFYSAIPADAVHLLSVPLSGNGLGVQTVQVFKQLTGVTLQPGDCLVTIFGLQGDGAFDNETQVSAIVAP